MNPLRRYWIEFEVSLDDKPPAGLLIGCGVTAHNLSDAMSLVKQQIFDGSEVPNVRRVVEDVDISTLDADHVRPNMGMPTYRGIWFPLGYG